MEKKQKESRVVKELAELHLNYCHFSEEKHCFNMKFWGALCQTNLSVKVGFVPLAAKKWRGTPLVSSMVPTDLNSEMGMEKLPMWIFPLSILIFHS